MSSNIIIANKAKFNRLKKNFVKGGPEKLHVIADFDKTLTPAFIGGKPFQSIISILRNGNYLSPDYAAKAHALFEKYHKMEIDRSISLVKRKMAMREWWSKHFKLLIKCGLHEKDILSVVNSGNLRLRKGTDKLFKTLNKNNVPIIIFSATGLGETIPLYLKKKNLLDANIFTITNTFTWDKNGNATGINKPIIHSLNKNERTIHHSVVYKNTKQRKNIILLGDSVSDVDMATGFKYDNILKIGFLNEKIEEKLALYKKNFDALILNDGNFDFVNELLREIM
ncbi:MAG: hypothetical protein V1928_05040 [Parcubacteria group bacterium]